MSQHDFDIANATASVARADINAALKALASLSSGSTEPATTYANMLWYDTGTNTLKMMSEANDQWVDIGYLDQGSGTFEVAGITNATIISALGFTPVQQGGGSGQGTNKVYIGWDGGGLKAQVDGTDLGRFAFGSGYTDAQARNAQAGHAAGGVGSYALLNFPSEPNASPGSTHAGSSLRYSSANGFDGGTPSGTWRLMGFVSSNSSQGSGNNVSVFLRVS